VAGEDLVQPDDLVERVLEEVDVVLAVAALPGHERDAPERLRLAVEQAAHVLLEERAVEGRRRLREVDPSDSPDRLVDAPAQLVEPGRELRVREKRVRDELRLEPRDEHPVAPDPAARRVAARAGEGAARLRALARAIEDGAQAVEERLPGGAGSGHGWPP
jgi:hypothetical protein